MAKLEKHFRKAFSTPEYAGIWLHFDSDRLGFRRDVEAHIRAEMNDPDGALLVDESGPRWKSAQTVELSYSHSADVGILIYSRTHRLGVDIESAAREFKGNPLKLATRFFPAADVQELEMFPEASQKNEFLKRWVQKEAYAKITRLGLAKTLEQGVKLTPSQVLQALPVSPVGIFGAMIMEARA